MKAGPEAGAVMAGTGGADRTSSLAERGKRIREALANPNIMALDKIYWEKVNVQFQKDVDDAFEARARQLMAEVTTNPAALERMAGLAEATPGGLPGGFGRSSGPLPRAMKNKEVAEAEEEARRALREIEEAERDGGQEGGRGQKAK